jgi:hypothetical protein
MPKNPASEWNHYPAAIRCVAGNRLRFFSVPEKRAPIGLIVQWVSLG